MSWTIGCKGDLCNGVECHSDKFKAMIGPGKFEQECCLPNHVQYYAITCLDAYGDGWHGGYLEINGEKYCENFDWVIGKGSKMLDTLPNMFYNRDGMIIWIFDYLSNLIKTILNSRFWSRIEQT